MNHPTDDSQRVNPGGEEFRLADRPWLSLLLFVFLFVLVLVVTDVVLSQVYGRPADSRTTGFLNALVSHGLLLFVITPFVLRLPKGRRSFTQYLGDIGMTRVRPTGRLLLLALSCWGILVLSQATGSIVYRLSEGLPVTAEFLRSVFDISRDLPPRSLSPLVSLPSAFEEVAFRGVILTLFLTRYSRRWSIVIASGGFSILHLLNLLGDRDPVWVFGQLGWAFLMGLFYGYLFVKTGSLLPPMLVHYLGNVFIGSLTAYMESSASAQVQALYGVTFSLGLVPVTLMILWVRFFAGRWLPRGMALQSGAEAG